MKLFNMGSFFSNFDPLKIDISRCLQTISPLTQCNSCVNVCPTHSLFFDENTLKYTDCINCGACVKVCPQEVFSMDFPKLSSNDASPLFLTCQKILSDHSSVVSVGCLDQFSAEMLLELSMNRDVYIFADDTCSTCKNYFRLDNLQLLLERFPTPHRCHFISDKEEFLKQINTKDTIALTRRGFFEQALQKGQKHTSQSIANTIDKGEQVLNDTIDFITDTHQLYRPQKIISARYRLLPYFSVYLDSDVDLPYRMLHLSECDFCCACAHLCPTEALQLIKDEQKSELKFAPYLCNNCNLCLDICPKHSLYWQGQISIKNLIQNHTLADADVQVCSQCGEEFFRYPKSDSPLCRFCK